MKQAFVLPASRPLTIGRRLLALALSTFAFWALSAHVNLRSERSTAGLTTAAQPPWRLIVGPRTGPAVLDLSSGSLMSLNEPIEAVRQGLSAGSGGGFLF